MEKKQKQAKKMSSKNIKQAVTTYKLAQSKKNKTTTKENTNNIKNNRVNSNKILNTTNSVANDNECSKTDDTHKSTSLTEDHTGEPSSTSSVSHFG